MPKVVCDECNTKFSIAAGAIGGKCPACGASKRVAKSSPGDSKSKGVRCPMCKTTLPQHITFCAKCGVDAGESNAAAAGIEIDNAIEKRKAQLAWQQFFTRMFRWW